MSLIPKCDLCGKSKPKVKFSGAGIKLQVPNYKGNKLNFTITVNIEDPRDKKTMLDFENKVAELSMYALEEGGEIGTIIDDEIFNLQLKTMTKLKTPNPLLCDKCKKEIVKLAWSYGSFKGFAKPFS